jgi:hypothetical protein
MSPSSPPSPVLPRARAFGRATALQVAAFALALLAPGPAFVAPLAAADDAFRILYHEPLRELRVDSAGRATGFEAFGRRFDLRLERNESLRFVTPQRMPGVEALRGTLEGVPGSWLRLTRTPSGLYGLIFDGSDYYAVEPAAEAAGGVVGPLAARGSAPVIYRLADTLVQAGAASCGAVRHVDDLRDGAAGEPVTAQQVLERFGGGFDVQAATLPTRQLQVTVVGDYELSQLANFVGSSGTAEQAIAVRMNVVDGIFAAQLGVKVVVAEARVFRDPNDPFTSTTAASTLLGELASWRQSTPGQSARGLTHLITGRELDGSTVGVAYVGGLCSPRFSAGLSQGNLSATNSALVIAHEMGHNFGASHDGETGSSCESTATTFLMAARLNGSQTFSQCSLDAIRPRIAAAPTSCLAVITVPDADIDAPAPARRLRGVSFDYTFNVRSIGALAIDGVTATVTLPAALTLNSSQVAGGGSCTAGSGGTLNCTLGSIPVQTSRAVTLNLRASQSGTASMTIAIAAPADAVAVNNTAQVAFGIDPSADLSVTLSAAPATLTTAGSSQVTARVRHLEGDPAADARLSFELPAGLTVSGVATNNLGCTLAAGTVSCAPRGLAAGASEDVVLTVGSPQTGTRSIRATVAATVGDPVSGNNSAETSLEVSAPPPSGGGGGSLGAGLLLLLSLALGLRCAGRR